MNLAETIQDYCCSLVSLQNVTQNNQLQTDVNPRIKKEKNNRREKSIGEEMVYDNERLGWMFDSYKRGLTDVHY